MPDLFQEALFSVGKQPWPTVCTVYVKTGLFSLPCVCTSVSVGAIFIDLSPCWNDTVSGTEFRCCFGAWTEFICLSHYLYLVSHFQS